MGRAGIGFAAWVLLVALSATSCGLKPSEMLHVLSQEQSREDRVPTSVTTPDGTTKELSAATSQHLLNESGFAYFAVETESGDICLYVDPLHHASARFGAFHCKPPSAIKSADGLRVGLSYKEGDGAPYFTHAILLPDGTSDELIPGGYERVDYNLALGPRSGNE